MPGYQTPKYVTQYLGERNEDHDWETQIETPEWSEARRHADELIECSGIDGVRILEVRTLHEELDPNSHGRPWSKPKKKKGKK